RPRARPIRTCATGSFASPWSGTRRSALTGSERGRSARELDLVDLDAEAAGAVGAGRELGDPDQEVPVGRRGAQLHRLAGGGVGDVPDRLPPAGKRGGRARRGGPVDVRGPA